MTPRTSGANNQVIRPDLVRDLVSRCLRSAGSTGPSRAPVLGVLITASLLFSSSPSGAQIMEKKILAPDGGTSDWFGQSVALVQGWAFCGAPLDDDIQGQSGAVYVFRESSGDWTFAQKLKASDPTYGGELGYVLAASGSWLVATTPYDDPQGYYGRGSAHVYNLQGGSWVHSQKMLASDFKSIYQQYFGRSAALKGDRMVIGEPNDDSKWYDNGSVYVFELQGTTWVEVAKLWASDYELYGGFGSAVAVDGDTMVVGAPSHDNGSPDLNYGAAYVFERIGGTWIETQKLVASDPQQGDLLGSVVAIHGDTIMVSSCHHSHGVPGQGVVYVFIRQGSTWIQRQELVATDSQPSDALCDCALESDVAVIGATGDDDLGGTAGSAYSFRRSSGGAWQQIGKLLAADGKANQLLGFRVALAEGRAIAGAWGDQTFGVNSGAAYVFELAPDAVQYGSCPSQGPCGNHDNFGGCRTSSGHGGVLSAAGSGSVSTDDLRLEARWLPSDKIGLFFMGGWATALPFADGQLCVASGGAGIWRFNPPQSSGAAGVLELGPGVAGLSTLLPPGGHIAPGQTWHFQAWFRDPAGPCGKGSNMTNALRVAFGP